MNSPIDNPSAGGSSGAISAQTDVKLSRAIDGTVYHNTTAKPIYCLVTCQLPASSQVYFYSDSNAAPSLQIGTSYNNNLSTIYMPIYFVVLPGNYYKAVGGGTAALTFWIEYT